MPGDIYGRHGRFRSVLPGDGDAGVDALWVLYYLVRVRLRREPGRAEFVDNVCGVLVAVFVRRVGYEYHAYYSVEKGIYFFGAVSKRTRELREDFRKFSFD